MLRVIYRWTIKPGAEAPFRAAWAEVTRRLRATAPGALGSVLMRSAGEPTVLVAVARWRDRDAWEAMRAGRIEPPLPSELGRVMREATEGPPTFELYDELDDLGG